MEKLLVSPTKAQEKAVMAFLEALNVPFERETEVLPAHVAACIRRGQEDVKERRLVTLEEFKSKRSREK